MAGWAARYSCGCRDRGKLIRLPPCRVVLGIAAQIAINVGLKHEKSLAERRDPAYG